MGEVSHFDKRRNREINKIKWGRRTSVVTANYGFDDNIFFGLVCLRACNHPLSQGILFKKGGEERILHLTSEKWQAEVPDRKGGANE